MVISVGATITKELGMALDDGHMGGIFVVMIGAVSLTIIQQLALLKPKTIDMKM